LSEALQAPEPFFRLGINRLEKANGNQSTDIRVSTSVLQQTQSKIRQLGLDPVDTTAAELYHVLSERVKDDDAKLTKTLRREAATYVSAEGNVVDGMVHVLTHAPGHKSCYALKASSLRALMKKAPPKKAMKQLGYRSLDSFLKHEAPAAVLAAAWLTESVSWQKQLLDQYKKLKPKDFETRMIAIVQPGTRHWQELAAKVVDQKKHNLLSFKELGAAVLLPLPKNLPAGAVTVSLSLALHELNEIRATSTFLKLCQVRADFGSLVQTVARDEPHVSSKLLDQPVPWHLIQRYYSRLSNHFREQLFEPHIQLEDMAWQPIERMLSHIEPSMAFWHDSSHLGLMQDRQPVSLNIVDAALNLCNHVPFENRIANYFRHSLWHELLLNYLNHDTVEQTVLAQLQPQLAVETALA
jgi:hypothetical protein